MRKASPPLILAALLALLLSGCGHPQASGSTPFTPGSDLSVSPSQPAATAPADSSADPAQTASADPSAPASQTPDANPDKALLQAARDAVDALRDRDLDRLTDMIDPDQGLRFSPYAHIDGKAALLFKSGELPSFKDTAKLTWGAYDGSGEPIALTFRDYFEKFVYDQDFSSAPDVSVNTLKGKGNVPFNGKDLYPDASFVEFHFSGFDQKNDGMDWKSLILVLRPAGQEYKLCAIVHAGWTI